MRKQLLITCGLAIGLASAFSSASEGPVVGHGSATSDRQGPPPEFARPSREEMIKHHEMLVAACKGKKDGDQVQVQSPRGDTVTARCTLVATVTPPAGRGPEGKGPEGRGKPGARDASGPGQRPPR